MPRGENPNSRANLKRFGIEKEARTEGKKGGKASGKARAEYKSLTEALKAQVGSDELAELTMMLYKRAKQGNLKAYELLRDQLGEKPAEHIQVTQVDTQTIADIEELINANTGTAKDS